MTALPKRLYTSRAITAGEASPVYQPPVKSDLTGDAVARPTIVHGC